MVLFHTSFKFGGIVSVSFWSMVAVFLSGIIGRFIYIQIPRSIEGRALSLNEVRDMKADICDILKGTNRLDDEAYHIILSAIAIKSDATYRNPFGKYFNKYMNDFRALRLVKTVLRNNKLPTAEYKKIVEFVKKDISLSRKIERLVTMQKLFNYWHVAHMPFALVMLIIMVIHVAITIVFGYQWIF
jgi:cobalamin biosynthesis Co2+ chelatase CbiK